MSEVIVFSDRNFNPPIFHRFSGDTGVVINGETLPITYRLQGFSAISYIQEKKPVHVLGSTIGYVQEKKVYLFGGSWFRHLNNVVPPVPVDLPLFQGLCVNPYSSSQTFETIHHDHQMLFRMLRPNLMSHGHLLILVSANGRQDNENYIGQMFHTLTQQWDLISHPRRNHTVSFVVMVLDNEQNPYLLFGFSDHQFSFYSICHQKVGATYFKVNGLAQVLNWEERSNLGGVEVVYSFSQGILVVVNLVESHVSHIDMHALMGDNYRADDVEARLLAANGKLHLVWSPEHLQPDLGCLIVWSSFRIIGGVPEFSVVDFGQVTFMVNDPARLTAVEFVVL